MLDVVLFFEFVRRLNQKYPGEVSLHSKGLKGELVTISVKDKDYLLFKVTSGHNLYWLEMPGAPPVRYAFAQEYFAELLELI